VELRVLGGVREIGGNRILLRSSNESIFLDYGKNFLREEEFFQRPFMSPSFSEDYLKTGLISSLEHENLRGVLISHAHQDHWGYLNLLPQGIEVYMGEAAGKIIGANVELGYAEEVLHTIRTFRTGDTISLGDFSIVPIHVDHSVPGSYGFLIECGNIKLAYTGDLRMHGPRRDMTLDFIDEAASMGVDALIMEATKVAPENDPETSIIRLLETRLFYRWGVEPPKRIKFELSNEEEVTERIKSVCEGSDSIILIETSSSDADRIRSVFEAAKKLSRVLVMDERIAFINEAMKGAGINGLPGIGDYLLWRRKRRGEGEERTSSRERRGMRIFIERFEDLSGEEAIIQGERRAEIFKEPHNFLVLTSNATRFLYEIPMDAKVRLDFILSRSESFSEESALSLDRLMNWLLLYGVRRYYRIHVSGHMMPEQMGEFVESINPGRIIPIHTEHPDLFDAFVPRRMRDLIILPEYGKLIKLG
jgi:ribonuclease J